eukprot:12933624-Alexandrium_andersonii.AAC.1
MSQTNVRCCRPSRNPPSHAAFRGPLGERPTPTRHRLASLQGSALGAAAPHGHRFGIPASG